MFNERGRKLFIQLCAILVVALAIQALESPIFRSPLASAAAADELHGWAWSSNIGWVSFNCADTASGCSGSDYKVRVDSGTGNLSGYAWSSNIGWIQFNPSSPYPVAGPSYSARIDNPGQPSSPLSGWARALSNNVPNGGWDGWINMSGPASGGGSYGVSISGSEFSGFAWGGEVVGWVSFNCADAGNCGAVNYKVTRSGGSSPACPTFTSSPNTIIVTPGGSGTTTLSWQCINVIPPPGCSINQGIGGVPDSGSRQVTLSRTTTYELSCSGSSGATATTYVEVKVFTPTREEIRPK